MRLVDAEDLMRCITKEYNRRGTGEGLRLAWIEKAVNDAPTVSPDMAQVLAYECGKDSVQVVRCKDCRYWWEENELCKHPDHCDGNVCCHECGATAYCSDGERRSE